ncbi:MAG: pyridoxal phosphate-dependent aminotransferase [Desulfovibrionaceae bacterium]|nr:pyridoxal phosphate-dependent aminotransferase [Desulfovibrionaceae bacterium]
MFNERLEAVKPFLAMEIFERANAMERANCDIVHLEVGEPDFATPPPIVQACEEALEHGLTHYTNSMGDVLLREKLADSYDKRYKVKVKPEQFVIFPGSSLAMATLFQTLLNPGDEVILSNPGYPSYPNFIRFAGGVPCAVETHEDDGFCYRVRDVKAKISPRTKAILLNSPCNPTGIVMEKERLQGLCDLDTLVISDEIYHGLTYGSAEEHCALEFTNNCVIVGGFSKAYAMTGWRLGYLILPENVAPKFQAFMQNFVLSTNLMVQMAGITALKECGVYVERARSVYDERRRYLLEKLPELGFTVPVEPRGAFYILVNARHLEQNSFKLALDILEKAHVGLTPGIDFGSQSEGFLRISYANSLSNIKEAMRRLEKYLDSRAK